MFVRNPQNPIFTADPLHPWESMKVYNPGILFEHGVYHMFYNAVGEDWVLRIGYATSTDGIHFKRQAEPLLVPDAPWDKNGLMDSRITKVDDTYYLTYSADDGVSRKLALATSLDLSHWTKQGLMLPEWDSIRAGGFRVMNGERVLEDGKKKNRSKGGGIFSEKIDGKYLMIFGNSNLWFAWSNDGVTWESDYQPVLTPREGDFFDNLTVQGGPPPLKTDKGWLYFYHGRSRGSGDYHLGGVLLDLANPRKILARCDTPLFSPQAPYETCGIMDLLEGGFPYMKTLTRKELDAFVLREKEEGRMLHVVFCCGAVIVEDKVKIYYGASDTVIGVTEDTAEDVLEVLS